MLLAMILLVVDTSFGPGKCCVNAPLWFVINLSKATEKQSGTSDARGVPELLYSTGDAQARFE